MGRTGATTYREARLSDVPAMAKIRAQEWGTEELWRAAIPAYMRCEHHPRQALKPRTVYAAFRGDVLIGYIAGHLTRRYGCDGELQWINVSGDYRRSGVASELLHLLAEWFVTQTAAKICVNVEPANAGARRFYKRHGAGDLSDHWLVWEDIALLARGRALL